MYDSVRLYSVKQMNDSERTCESRPRNSTHMPSLY